MTFYCARSDSPDGELISFAPSRKEAIALLRARYTGPKGQFQNDFLGVAEVTYRAYTEDEIAMASEEGV